MNKKFTLLSLLTLLSIFAYAQNIGIGTSTPVEKLHVAGTLRVDDLQTAVATSNTTDKVIWVDANGKVYSFPTGAIGKVLGIDPTGKLAWLNAGLPNALNNGQVWIGDITNTPIAQTPSGDALISNAGVITIQDDAVDGTDITISAESNGSLMYFNGTNWVNLGIGAAGQILSSVAGIPTWVNPPAAPTVGDLTTTTAGVSITGGVGAVNGAGTTVNVATNALNQDGLVTGPTVGNTNQVWGTNGGGIPAWRNPNSLLSTNDVVSSNTAINVVNGTGQVVGGATLTIAAQMNALNQNGFVPGPTVGNPNQVWATNGAGVPSWQSANNTIIKNDLLAGVSNNAVSITNGTGQIVGGLNATINVATNALNQSGVVLAPTGANAFQVWGTNGAGVPAWVDPTSLVDVDNGLYYNGVAGRVRQGGALVENTTITQGNFNMLHDLTGIGIYDVQTLGTTALRVLTNGDVGIGSVSTTSNTTNGRTLFFGNAANVSSTSGMDMIIDMDNNSINSEFTVKRDGDGVNELLKIQEDGDAIIGNPAVLDNSAILHVNSTTKGILPPNVALSATNVAAPTTLPATSLLLYNTATAGAGATAVTPGYYYNAGTSGAPNWMRLEAGGNDWHITGNTGTSAATNFIGTSDNIDFVTKTNNIERMRVMNDGRVKIGVGGTNFKYGLSRMEIEGEGVQPHISYVSDYPSFIMMRHNGTLASPTNLANGDNVGEIRWYGYNTSTYYQTARILSYVDGAPVANSIPGNLIFQTLTAGNSVTDEKMIIKNNGNVGIGTMIMGGPLAKLHVYATGANWNTAATNGDFYVGDGTYRLKLGVATGGGGAGDVRITASGGTNRLFLGGGANTNVAVINGTNQRVGINTYDPNTSLDVVGDLALKTAPATLTGAAPDYSVNTTTTPRSYYRVSSPVANFNIISLNNPAAVGIGSVDGRVVTLYNATNFTMTIANQHATPAAADRIITGTGADLIINAGGSVTFVYNTTDTRWVISNTSNEAAASSGWGLLGNTGTSSATNFLGTTDLQSLVFKTNNVEGMRLDTDGELGVGVANPTYKLHVQGNVRFQGDFVNQEATGTHANTVQNVPFTNGVFNPILGTDNSITIADGNGVNNSAVFISGFARIFGGTLNGGTSSMGGYFLILQRDVNPAFPAPVNLTYTSGMCYLKTPNGAGSAALGFGGGGHVSYIDMNLTAGVTYYYRLVLYPNGVSITSGTYDVYERDLSLLQIKR